MIQVNIGNREEKKKRKDLLRQNEWYLVSRSPINCKLQNFLHHFEEVHLQMQSLRSAIQKAMHLMLRNINIFQISRKKVI